MEKPEIVPAEAEFAMEESLQVRAIRRLEDKILAKSAQIVHDASFFASLDPAAEGPPEEWVEELGEDAAQERFRLARFAALPQAEAPVGFKMAQGTFVGIVKARATEKTGPKTLNMTLVQMPNAQVTYPMLKRDDE